MDHPTLLTREQAARCVALREAAILTKGDAVDTVMLANFILTGTDELPNGDHDRTEAAYRRGVERGLAGD